MYVQRLLLHCNVSICHLCVPYMTTSAQSGLLSCRFPFCLELLTHLQQPAFRTAIKRRDTQTALAWQLHYFFTHFRNNRLREEAANRAVATADKMDES